jgi:peptide/nickel transport system substrate-binding protein
MTKLSLSRRNFLILGGGVVVAGAGAATWAAVAGGGSARPAFTGNGVRAANGRFAESPLLHSRVAAGSLPPVEQRLPKEPVVVKSGSLLDERILKPRVGVYGGSMKMAHVGTGGDGVIGVGMTEPLLWAPGGFDFAAGITGNVVAGWEANADNTVFTFHMRDGLKWSDGEPVTTSDVQFAFEDVLLNPALTPALPPYLRAGYRPDAAPAALKVIDEYTFSLTFDRPYGSFPGQLAISQWRGYADIIKPRHYLEQFHEKYASRTTLAGLVADAKLPKGEWFNLFNSKQIIDGALNLTTDKAVGHPMLSPWILAKTANDTHLYQVNPYYFKVDSAGNQLPYLDEVQSASIASPDTLVSRALFGEFDYLGDAGTLRNVSLMRDKERQGQIKLLVGRFQSLTAPVMFNLTYPDPVWRQVVRDLRFRQAMSLAINRQEIISNLFLGEFAKVPSQTGRGEYNVDEANRLLDQAGLARKDGEGFRLGPDGKRFTVPLETLVLTPDYVPIGELITEHFKKVGVFTTFKQPELSEFIVRRAANGVKAQLWLATGALFWRSAGWDDYLPQDSWGGLWQKWYATQGKEGEEPPAEVKALFDAHAQLQSAAPNTPESKAAYDAIVKSHVDNLWMIEVCEDSYVPTFFKTRVKNVPSGVKLDVLNYMVNFSMEQWYLEGA